MPNSVTQLEKHCWRRGWRWSLVMHSLLVSSVLMQALWFPFPSLPASREQQLFLTQADAASSDREIIVELAQDDRPWMAREAESMSFEPVDLQDSRWKEIVEEPFQQNDQVTQAGQLLLQREIERSMAATSQRSQAENLDDLGRLSQQLTSVSSEKTVEEMNGTIGRLLGTAERATAPVAEKTVGEFDFTSAQVHDVRKEERADGTTRYVAIMLDSAGRTQEVELDDASGESAFRTMQIVKSNPLLERVYRGVVMGVIDKVLQGSK